MRPNPLTEAFRFGILIIVGGGRQHDREAHDGEGTLVGNLASVTGGRMVHLAGDVGLVEGGG